MLNPKWLVQKWNRKILRGFLAILFIIYNKNVSTDPLLDPQITVFPRFPTFPYRFCIEPLMEHLDAFMVFGFLISKPSGSKMKQVVGENESPVWIQKIISLKEMDHLISEDASGWNIFRIHRSSGWSTSRLLPEFWGFWDFPEIFIGIYRFSMLFFIVLLFIN